MALTVDADRILQPLGLIVIEDNREELLPPIELFTESIPGKDGVTYFGFRFKPRPLELVVGKRIQQGQEVESVAKAFLRDVAAQISPFLGEQELTYADEPGKVYNVIITGTGRRAMYADYVEASIKMQMNGCFIVASIQSSLVGSGTAVNGGNVETPVIVEVVGPVTNPSVNIAGLIMTYTGTVTASDKLIIDTGKRTCTFNGVNALGNLTKVWPRLAVGNNTVTVSGGTVTTKWTNSWL